MMAESGIIPEIFRRSPSAAATYDSSDFFTRTGYKAVYGCHLIEAGAGKYSLVTDVIPAYNTYTEAANAAMDIDFDMKVSNAMSLDGDAVVFVPVYANVASSAVTCTIKLYHVSAADVETQLGSTVTQAYTFPGAGYKWKAITGKITIANRSFLPDEKIRISVTTSAGGVNVTVYIGHDPNNTFFLDTAIYSNKLTALLPFKLDL